MLRDSRVTAVLMLLIEMFTSIVTVLTKYGHSKQPGSGAVQSSLQHIIQTPLGAAPVVLQKVPSEGS